ncbi:4'-phosphopantetheinyl transferase family protein [Geodermatophilus marinus]|uniref:4'-phosphopantetheinyl transferase family protein n=1 Tax=Geodermatophilus sp. LHW52908 TaxID=2303986 RepID=UPI0013145B97|nr:4'-phosphopantetheinyl transferase superfamily protein [Geodermatophilus sp. LHW52908]
MVRSLDLADAGWDAEVATECLDAGERARAARGTPAVHRRRVLVRAGLRRVLGGLLGVAPADVPLRTDGDRPHLPGAGLQFSCSASGDLALLAVSRDRPVGVDVQRHRDEDAGGASDEGWLAAEELARLRSLPHGRRARAVTRAWTQKEAMAKARGTGLRRFPVDLVTPIADRGRSAGLHLAPVRVPVGYVASLAAAAPPGPDVLVPVPLTPGGRP